MKTHSGWHLVRAVSVRAKQWDAWNDMRSEEAFPTYNSPEVAVNLGEFKAEGVARVGKNSSGLLRLLSYPIDQFAA